MYRYALKGVHVGEKYPAIKLRGMNSLSRRVGTRVVRKAQDVVGGYTEILRQLDQGINGQASLTVLVLGIRILPYVQVVCHLTLGQIAILTNVFQPHMHPPKIS